MVIIFMIFGEIAKINKLKAKITDCDKPVDLLNVESLYTKYVHTTIDNNQYNSVTILFLDTIFTL